MKNTEILSIGILIGIILLLHFLKKNNINIHHNFSKNKPLRNPWDKPERKANNPIYLNDTQTDYLELEELFNSLCNRKEDPRKLVHYKYTDAVNGTVDLQTRMNCQRIMEIILTRVNADSKFKFVLSD